VKRSDSWGNRVTSACRNAFHGAGSAGLNHTVPCGNVRTSSNNTSNGATVLAASDSSGTASSNDASGTNPNTRFTCGGHRSCTPRTWSIRGQSDSGGSHATAVRAVDGAANTSDGTGPSSTVTP
jgi:hypothetical protein